MWDARNEKKTITQQNSVSVLLSLKCSRSEHLLGRRTAHLKVDVALMSVLRLTKILMKCDDDGLLAYRDSSP
jgi:hypothetical protein